MADDKNLMNVLVMEEDSNKKLIPKKDTYLATSENRIEDMKTVPGGNATNGTEILKIIIEPGKTVYLFKVSVACNLATIVEIGAGTAMPPTTPLDFFLIPSAGSETRLTDGDHPLLKVTNTTTANLNLYIWAPHTALGITPNDATSKWYYASYGGTKE